MTQEESKAQRPGNFPELAVRRDWYLCSLGLPWQSCADQVAYEPHTFGSHSGGERSKLKAQADSVSGEEDPLRWPPHGLPSS